MECHQNYIAVDIETTGLNAKTEKIIEIGAVRVIDGRETAQFHSMVNPHRALETRIIELTGITDEMVEHAPDIGDIIGEFLDFCGELPLLGHQILFDYSFLKRAAVNEKLKFERCGIDTLRLCRVFMPTEHKKNLAAACEFYQIKREGAHRALGDARDAHNLFCAIVSQAKETDRELFVPKPLNYKVKREQPASEKQKQDLQELIKYHRIELSVQIDYLSRSEASRIKDKLISQFGRIK